MSLEKCRFDASACLDITLDGHNVFLADQHDQLVDNMVEKNDQLSDHFVQLVIFCSEASHDSYPPVAIDGRTQGKAV